MKRLSIIVISWNEKKVLERCLSSFYESFDFEKDEVIVIDNGSSDGTIAMLKGFPKVKSYFLKENIGVGPARNKGILMSSGKFLMTLDNDTIVGDCNFGDMIEKIYSERGEVGVIGFKLLNSDGSFQQSVRRFPGWLQPLSSRVKPLRKLPLFSKSYNRHMMADIDFGSIGNICEVDYMLGANQVFKRDLLLETGFYDEKIFFGPEDFDFCYRVKSLGYKNYISSEITIVHDYQRRTRRFGKMMFKHLQAYYYVMLKNKINWV